MRRRTSIRPRTQYAIAIFVAYFFAALLADYASALFAPTVLLHPAGVGFAAALLLGRQALPAIFLAAFTAGVWVGDSILVVINEAVAATVFSYLTSEILRYYHFDCAFARMRDALIFIATTALATIVIPTMTVTGYMGAAGEMSLGNVWLRVWVGAFLSAITVTPFLIRWLSRPISPHSTFAIAERCAYIATILLYTFFSFQFSQLQTGFTSFGILILLFLVAFRTGPRWMTLTFFLMTLAAVAGVMDVFPPVETGSILFSLQILAALLIPSFLVLAALEEERKIHKIRAETYAHELRDALSKIEQSDRAKSDFIAQLGHELRNPLATLVSAVDLVEMERAKKKEQGETLHLMRSATRSMSYLLNDLLDLAQISKRKLNLNREWVAIGPLMRSAANNAAHHIEKNGHRLTLDIPRGNLRIWADPFRLEQILGNLLDNASKYTAPGGNITFSATHEEDDVVFIVSDTGEGIPKDMHESIFHDFVQVQREKNIPGLGLGLALVKNLVEMHSGTIAVTSVEGSKGSVFTVRLPLRMSEQRN